MSAQLTTHTPAPPTAVAGLSHSQGRRGGSDGSPHGKDCDRAGPGLSSRGSRIRKLRRELALSQAQVARSVGVTVTVVSCIERGRRSPGRDLLFRLADLFGVSAEYIERGRDAMRIRERRTDATNRAEPGLSPRPETFARDRAPLELQLQGEKLELLTDLMLAYPDQIALSGVYFSVQAIEAQCRRLRRDLIPKLRNDIPLCVRGSLLDVTA